MIRRIFDLENLIVESEVEGITDWKPGLDIKEDIKKSRGEFIGYLSGSRMLQLFRDRVGARNLYYSINFPRIFVSTDILWVLRNCGYGKELNFDYLLSEYLEFQVPFTDHTIYQNIYKVMPGEIVTILDDGLRKKDRYWSISDYFNKYSFERGHLLDLITDAVDFRKDIIGDNFTSYLSGGLDSSSITLLSKPREVFSGYYEQKEFSEIDYIRTVLMEIPETKGNYILITKNKFHDGILMLPRIIPDPQCGMGIIPQVIVAMEARNKNYPYSFSGEGGDELGLYPFNYAIIEQARNMRMLMDTDRYLIGWESMCQKFLHHCFSALLATAVGRGPSKGTQMEIIDDFWDYDLSIEDNLFLFNINIGLPAILTVDECVGKFTGVMPVSPLVDHLVVEYVASVCSDERCKIPKYIFREAMRGILPEKIRSRLDKMGFPIDTKFLEWPMLQQILSSLKKRDMIKVPNADSLSRQIWSYINIELILREINGKSL